ncbi:Zn-ribbon domain-containing OB-fold protein [Achromobacter marplatensis]|uniref:Zn-ribbon domain-containing OB-fold protein n=1 Tax=Achromobacter marplatensis TaxID=470868 RepID=UPI0039F678A0
MSEPERLLPQPTDLTRPFWEAAQNHQLTAQFCLACRQAQFYPRPFCVKCGSEKIEWKALSGKGRIYTYTINQRAPNAFMKTRLPYAVAIVDLDEGVRMMGNIVDSDLADIQIGKQVHVVFEALSQTLKLPQFTLAPVTPPAR